PPGLPRPGDDPLRVAGQPRAAGGEGRVPVHGLSAQAQGPDRIAGARRGRVRRLVRDAASVGTASKEGLFTHVAEQYAGFFGPWVMTIGRRARLFETLRDRGPLEADALASELGYEPRYVDTWCRGAYAFDLLEEEEGRFRVPEHVASIMLDPGEP